MKANNLLNATKVKQLIRDDLVLNLTWPLNKISRKKILNLSAFRIDKTPASRLPVNSISAINERRKDCRHRVFIFSTNTSTNIWKSWTTIFFSTAAILAKIFYKMKIKKFLKYLK